MDDKLPEAPKIDWEFYKSNVKPEFKAMVDQFKCAYEQLNIPKPIDTQTAEIDKYAVICQVNKIQNNFLLRNMQSNRQLIYIF